jgi:hypothetical protein
MTDHNFPRDATQFDRMVDGELEESAQRELLARLDDEPDGWRRLALAYVESQALCRELPAILAESSSSAAPAAVRPARPTSWSDVAWQMVTIASTLLLSFGLGLWVRGFWPPRGNVAADQADGRPAVADLTGSGAAASSPRPRLARDEANRPADRSRPPATLRIELGGDGRPVDVPIFEADAVDPSWLAEAPSVIPPEVRRALERSGHMVRQRRELVPIQLEDGRHVIVPVDHAELHYVGRPIQ